VLSLDEYTNFALINQAEPSQFQVGSGLICLTHMEAEFSFASLPPPIKTHLINRKQVRCQRFGAATRRKEGAYPLWICNRRTTPSQRQRSATLRAKLWRSPGGVAPQSQSAEAMLLRRALPAGRQSLAHPLPISEMGSRLLTFPQASNQPQIFGRLNEAHPSCNSDSFLAWRREGGGGSVG
jgi:hypothetical protein